MKKTRKKIFGLFGLAIVAVTTIFAAALPGPEASATSTMTDTITVRVIGAGPNITMESPTPDTVVTNSEQRIAFTYEGIEQVQIIVKYTDADGVTHEHLIDTISAGGNPGTYDELIDLSSADFGFGDYVIEVSGEGSDGVPEKETVSFSYYPVIAEVVTDEDTGKTYVDLEYEPDDGTAAGEGKVASLEINVYDENGNLVSELSPIYVDAPTDRVELNFAEHGLPSGNYRVEVTAFDRNKNDLFEPFSTTAQYTAIPVPVPETGQPEVGKPDTGGLLQNLNISKSDYLITGLIVFLLAAIVGAGFIIKNNRKQIRSSSKRRK